MNRFENIWQFRGVLRGFEITSKYVTEQTKIYYDLDSEELIINLGYVINSDDESIMRSYNWHPFRNKKKWRFTIEVVKPQATKKNAKPKQRSAI